MMWITLLAIVSAVLGACFLVCVILLYCNSNAKYSLKKFADRNNEERSKYLVTPSKEHKFEFDEGIPCSPSKPINVQLNSTKLNLKTFILPTNSSVTYNPGFGFAVPPKVYQTPLISNYENTSKKGRSRKRTPKRSLRDSFDEIANTAISTNTIATDVEPDTNANFAENGETAEPELKFSIFYDSPSKDLHVTVMCASNLPVSRLPARAQHTQSFRVKVRVAPWETEWRETRHACGVRDATFGETFIVSGLVHNKLRECSVHFVVVEFEEYRHCWTIIGEVRQSLVDFRANQLTKTTKKLRCI